MSHHAPPGCTLTALRRSFITLAASAGLAPILLAGQVDAQQTGDGAVSDRTAAAAATVQKAADGTGGAALIPRQVLFGNPDRDAPRISPDGRKVSFLAAVNGVLNVWVGPADDPKAARPVTNDAVRGIRIYFWAYDSRHILYLQDKGGDENWRVYAVDLDTGETRDLTPFDGVAARIEHVSPRFPEEILVGLNNRNKELHDVHRVNVRTGQSRLVLQNPDDVGFVGFNCDDDFNVRFGTAMNAEGGMDIARFEAGKWSPFTTVAQEDTLSTGIEGLDKHGKLVRMIDSRGRNTAALVEIDLATGRSKLLFQNPEGDVADVMIHPTEKTVEAAAYDYTRKVWHVLDKTIEPDLTYLRSVANGDLQVVSRSLDDQNWIVRYEMDDGPVRFYHYDRKARKANFLFTNRSALENLKLANMTPAVIKARDGLNLVSYLTVPVDASIRWTPDGEPTVEKPLPLVLFVHGGPWGRDEWGYDPYHQWLANRGYAVLSVNFRGSTGLGKKFTNAGDREWGAKMHDDLLDAVKWAVGRKVADPQRIAIMGGSYGGYATLWGLTGTPDVFACGVDIVGPSNLNTLLESIPPYWAPMIELFCERVGDYRTPEGRAFLNERSPLTFADRIRRPLLIGQGKNDPRVKEAESEQIVRKMKEKKLPVTYVLFPDEGHGFARPENNLAFNAVTEAFLGRFLGGRVEPIGDDFDGSSIRVPEGAEHLPELTGALPANG
jgi:dipeptidyl aminopeptidase/acylaminoacyl peptidase